MLLIGIDLAWGDTKSDCVCFITAAVEAISSAISLPVLSSCLLRIAAILDSIAVRSNFVA
jgi:hypothetical protein